MNKESQRLMKQARKQTGLARFERTTKGWRTPGTRANGEWSMLKAATDDLYNKLKVQA